MTNIAERNFAITPGNSGTADNPDGIVIVLKSDGTPENLTGSNVVFRVVNDSGVELIRKDTSVDVVVDALAGKVTIPITVAESRVLPQMSRYEIEQRLGTSQRTRLRGRLVATGGVNDD